MQQIRSGLARHKPMSGRAGFTLVEVLASLVVTTLLILALTPFVGEMLATWARGSETAGLVELKTRGIAVLRRDLRHAVVWTGFGRTENLLAFRGNESSLSFPVVAGLGPGRDGLEMLSITVGTSVDGRALVRRRAAIIGSTYASFADPVVLFSGPFKYVFRYTSRNGEQTPTWAGQPDLPSRVELQILGIDSLPLSTPIELPIFASLSAGCFTSSTLPGCPAIATALDEVTFANPFGLTPTSQ